MSLVPRDNFGRPTNTVGSFQTVSNSLSAMNSEMAAMQSELANELAAVGNIPNEWNETLEAYIYTANLPGLREGDLKVAINGRKLQISGVTSIVVEEVDSRGYKVRSSSSSSSFSTQSSLPGNARVDPGQVSYRMDNGVLTVYVPKVKVFY